MDEKVDKWGRKIRGGWSASHSKSKLVAERIARSKAALNKGFIWGSPKMSDDTRDEIGARPYYRDLS